MLVSAHDLRVPACRYDVATIALNCGSMYRDCIRDEALARYRTSPCECYIIIIVNVILLLCTQHLGLSADCVFRPGSQQQHTLLQHAHQHQQQCVDQPKASTVPLLRAAPVRWLCSRRPPAATKLLLLLLLVAACRMELYSEHFMNFFDRVEVANFEIASDAFSSFKV